MSKFEHSMRAFVRVAKCLSQVFGNELSFLSSSVQKVSPSANSLQEKEMEAQAGSRTQEER